MADLSLLVDGTEVPSASDQRVDVINPSTGIRQLTIPKGSEPDATRAVGSARAAFESGRWHQQPPSVRKKVLHRLADLIESNSTGLDVLDAEEMGKPISIGFGNAASAARQMRFYAESVDKITGDVYPSDAQSFVTQRRVPRGVVAAIVPWNFPTANTVLKVAPALAAGNTIVLKPSELASRSSFEIARFALEAGLPPGVLNVVPGLGETAGRALALHPDVDMVTFTGSTAVGRKMLEYAGQSNMKVVMAECGGKSPQILFDDGVDLDEACASIASLLLLNQGQLCSVGSRLLVQKSIQDEAVAGIIAHLGRAVIGNSLEPTTTFGPLASANQCDRVMRYIEQGEADGPRLAHGGKRILRESGGFFVEPTVFTDAPPASRIAQEEIFGPVLTVIPFEDEAEAVRITNGTKYGLVAYLWTASLSTGLRVAKAIHSPVLINACAPRGEGPGHAFSTEPAGQSGVGTESGMAGMESYMRRHLIWFNHP